MKLNFFLVSVKCIEKKFEIGSVFMGTGYAHNSYSCYAIYTSRNPVAGGSPRRSNRS